MKTIYSRPLMLCAGLTMTLLLQNCKKDKPIYPINNTGVPAKSEQANNLPSVSSQYKVSTLVKNVSLDQPLRLCSSAAGLLFASSPASNAVYSISQMGVITKRATLPAGSNIVGLKAGESGTIYAALVLTNQIVKIDKTGKVTNIPVSIGLDHPFDVAVGRDSTIYVADLNNRRIVKVTRKGVATVLAGKTGVAGNDDGKGAGARFNNIMNMRLAADGNLYVLDNNSPASNDGQKLRRVSLNGTVTTIYRLAETEQNASISDFAPAKRDKNFNVTTTENFFLAKRMSGSSGQTATSVSHLSNTGVETAVTPYLTGYQDGSADQAKFNYASGITVKPYGIFLSDGGNYAVRVIKRKL